MKIKNLLILAIALIIAPSANAALISEFQPNAPGDDPDPATIEISGTAGDSFTDYVLFSIETDNASGRGQIDRLFSFDGTFDSNGLFTVDIPDLENPSFVFGLSTGGFTASLNDDFDTDNDGVFDVSLASLGTVMDAVEVPDSVADADDVSFASALGGTEVIYTGDEPQLAFRDGSTGQWFFLNDDGSNDIFDANGNLFAASDFDGDPLATSFGAINASLTVIPEPGSMIALAGLGVAGLAARRRRNKSTK